MTKLSPEPSKIRRPIWKRLMIWGMPAVIALIAASPLRENYFEISKQLEIMTALFRELNIYYVDELQPGELMETGVDAMVESLDPYTIYYPESRVEDLRFMTTGEYGGVGASIQVIHERHTIIDVMPDFPAAKGGLKIGDVLLSIDGQSLEGMDKDLVPDLLQGASGSKVAVTFLRYGAAESSTVTLEREKIKLPAVPYRAGIADSTGYIILSQFTRGSSHEVRQAIRYLRDSIGIKQLVLDLRGNGGGLLQESIGIVNLFVDKGQEVVSTRGKKSEWMKSYVTLQEPLVPDLPLAVLIDEHSASASEIVAGTLQDLDRAVIVGQESFGKGLVQQNKPLAYGTKLKITVAKYYTASGRCIQRLDYGGKRSQDGGAQAVADSMIQVFYTKNGRPVVDGKGVQPDVFVDIPLMSYVLEGLYAEGLLFDYANAWAAKHDSIASAQYFIWSDEDWKDFVDFAQDSEDFTYDSESRMVWAQLQETAKREQYYLADTSAFSALSAVLAPNIDRELNQFRDEIQTALEQEIVLRYYLQRGVIEWLIPQDSTLNKAISLLSSGDYQALLEGPPAP